VEQPGQHAESETLTSPIGDFQLWFAVAGGGITWAVRFVISYALISLDCQWSWFRADILGMSGLQAVLLAINGVGIIITVAALVLSYRLYMGTRGDEGFNPEGNRFRFMAFIGLIFNIFSLTLIILEIIPSFIVPVCR
jgi:hypothetical protein